MEAKESECLEYRARLGTSIQPQSTFEPKTLPQLDAEVKVKIDKFDADLKEGHEKVQALINEIAALNTTVR